MPTIPGAMLPSPYAATQNIKLGHIKTWPATSERGHSGLVESDPELDCVPELSEAEISVLLKPVRHLLSEPAPPLLQCLGEVPVVESHCGTDPGIN